MSWCPQCRRELPEGEAACPDCGSAPVEKREDEGLFFGPAKDEPPWPLDGKGDKVRAVELLYAKNPVDLEMKSALLHAYGIPTFSDTPNNVFFTTVIFGGAILGAHLYVPENMHEEALALLDARAVEDDMSEDNTQQ